MKDHTKKLRTALKLRRDLVLELLSKKAPSEVSWIVPKGGLNLWITLPSWVDSNHLLVEAKKQELTFLPGSACYAVEHENHHLRLSYSYMNEQLLHQGITTLCEILASEISLKKKQNQSPYF
jgi:DNA-binding transcriptional MocR family regulator